MGSGRSPVNWADVSGLHLLAINAQDPISTTQIGDIDSRTLVTFLNDTTFVTLEPTASDLWTLTSKELVYSVDEGAAPPTIGRTILLDELQIEGRPRDLVFVEALGMFVVVEDGGSSIASLSGLVSSFSQSCGPWLTADHRGTRDQRHTHHLLRTRRLFLRGVRFRPHPPAACHRRVWRIDQLCPGSVGRLCGLARGPGWWERVVVVQQDFAADQDGRRG